MTLPSRSSSCESGEVYRDVSQARGKANWVLEGLHGEPALTPTQNLHFVGIDENEVMMVLLWVCIA